MKCHNIYKLIGEYGITLEDGEKIYSMIHADLISGCSVELDFAGVNVCASPFFNTAIGQLLKDMKPEELNRRLTVSHLAPAGMNVLEQVIQNSAQYYADTTTREALDAILSEQTADN